MSEQYNNNNSDFDLINFNKENNLNSNNINSDNNNILIKDCSGNFVNIPILTADTTLEVINDISDLESEIDQNLLETLTQLNGEIFYNLLKGE